MRALLFDPFAGISGDMVLGGLVDLGLPARWLHEFVASLGLGAIEVRVTRVGRGALDCARVEFVTPPETRHRHLSHVLEIIAGSAAPDRAKERAEAAFRRLAAAEAAIHGTTIERVHFHEVGALDAILDVLCTMAAVDELGFEAFHTRPVAVGSGWVDTEHGRLAVPAPATLRLLEGIATTGLDMAGECTTPTGAVILATLTAGAPPPSQVVVRASGYGAGSRDPADRPNCLRLISCDVRATDAEELVLLQADVDDMSGEDVPGAQAAVLAAGALDVVVAMQLMKKGRPGFRIEALVPAAALDAVTEAVFRSTSSIGLRYWPVRRRVLARREEVTEWEGQRVRMKHVLLPDGTGRAKPEYEDLARAAERLGMTTHEARRAQASRKEPDRE